VENGPIKGRDGQIREIEGLIGGRRCYEDCDESGWEDP
jgi:hypothetical protein